MKQKCDKIFESFYMTAELFKKLENNLGTEKRKNCLYFGDDQDPKNGILSQKFLLVTSMHTVTQH